MLFKKIKNRYMENENEKREENEKRRTSLSSYFLSFTA